MKPEIITDRLTLRYVTIDDVDAIQHCIHDPRIYKMVARIAPNQARKTTIDWILSHKHGRAENTNYVYAILLQDDLIGLIGFHRDSVSKPFEIGFWISPDVWSQGYVTEAGGALHMHLEETMGPQKTIGGHFFDNPASGRVLEKLGYVEVGANELYCAGRGKKLPHIMLERQISP